MKEAYTVRKIVAQIKQHLPQAVVIKMNDKSTAGIPDISVDYGGKHLWIEVKLFRPNETNSTLKKHINALQLAMCRVLAQQGRCLYFLGYPENRARLVTPDTLVNFDIEAYNRSHLYTGEFDDEVMELIAHIRGYGAYS